MTHLLEADGIQLNFNNRKILSDIYIRCQTGKISGLLGRNGQGKTCLMNIIYGNLQAYAKSVRFDNVSIRQAFKKPELLSFLPQFNFIPRSLTLKRVFADFNLDYSLFEKVFLPFQSKYKSSIENLSEGQQRLVEIYIILKSKSLFAMFDEPFTHLMPMDIEIIKQLLSEEKRNKGIIITDHLYQHVADVSDSLYILVNGKTYLTKTKEDIELLGYAKN